MQPRARWGIVVATAMLLQGVPALGADVEALLVEGEQAFVAGKYDEALAKFEAAIEADPERWEGYYYAGMVHHTLGDAEKAIDMYLEALDIEPQATEPLNNLAVAYLEAGKLQKALESCKDAMKVDPENFEAAYNLGLVLERMGKHEEAVEALLASAKLAEADPDPYIDVAEILYATGDPAGAGKALAEAFARAPGQVDLGLKALELLSAAGKAQQAVSLAKKLAKKLAKGGEPQQVLRVARSLRTLGEPAAALQLLTESPHTKTSFSLVTEMGLSQLALGECKVAAKTFGQALDIKPQSTAALLAKADALCCAGKWCKAKKSYKKFLATAKPDDPNVQKVKAKLATGKKGCKKK